jgi:DNA-directed RNA polymerase specialized sigma24 family protein
MIVFPMWTSAQPFLPGRNRLMADPRFDTTHMRDWLVRWRAGDRSAFDELLRQTTARLERLAHKMLSDYPNVRRWADTDDVLQNTLMRLSRTLKKMQPDSVLAFFGLAAEHLRRELLDLARHFYGAAGVGANHAGEVGEEEFGVTIPDEEAERIKTVGEAIRYLEEHLQR